MMVHSCVLGLKVDKDEVEVACREWSDRRVKLAKTRLLLCHPPAVVSFTVVELDGGRLVIRRGSDKHVDTVLDAEITDEEEAGDVRRWLMLVQYPDEVEPLATILSRKYRR